MFDGIAKGIQKNKEALSKIPTTNFKTVVAIYAAILSVVAYWIATFFLIPIDPVSLGMLFGFILTWLFDGRKQFEIKRRTQWKPSEMPPQGEAASSPSDAEQDRQSV